MEIVSERKFVSVSARKARLVASQIKRVSDPQRALILLAALQKVAADPIRKTLLTALSDARNTFKLSGTLRLKTVTVNEGRTLKRWRPVSRGSAHPIHKRTSHIRVVLEGE